MDIQTFQKVCEGNGLKYVYDLDGTDAAYAYVVDGDKAFTVSYCGLDDGYIGIRLNEFYTAMANRQDNEALVMNGCWHFKSHATTTVEELKKEIDAFKKCVTSVESKCNSRYISVADLCRLASLFAGKHKSYGTTEANKAQKYLDELHVDLFEFGGVDAKGLFKHLTRLMEAKNG